MTVTDLGRLANVGPVPIGAGAAAHDLAEHRIAITEQRVEETINEFRSECSASNVACRIERETCDPMDELRSLWRYNDLTVIGLRGLFEYGVVHNPDDTMVGLIKHGVRPILAVGREFRPIKRVLIAYNGSMESAKAMKRFIQSHLWDDPVVKIVCFNRKPKVGERLLDDAAEYCRAHGQEVERELIDKHPRPHLLTHAEDWNADLIVMGSTNRARIFSHVMGDTVIQAIRESSIPLYLTQ